MMPDERTRKNKVIRPEQPTMPSAAVHQNIPQHTMPSRSVQQGLRGNVGYVQQASPPHPAQLGIGQKTRQPRPKSPTKRWWLLGTGALVFGVLMACMALGVWAVFLYTGDNVLPGVSSLGVDLGGKSALQAAAMLESRWQSGIVLGDGERRWQVDAEEMGIRLDTGATALEAQAAGRSSGSMLKALLGGATVAPVLEVDLVQVQAYLAEMTPLLEIPPINAGVRLVDGQIVTSPPQMGRRLDANATLARWQGGLAEDLADGVLDLVMVEAAPSIVDASPLVAEASQLLLNPLVITAFDPIRNEKIVWTLPPQEWSRWLMAEADATASTGLALVLEKTQLAAYLNAQAETLDAGRFLMVDEAVDMLAEAMLARRTEAFIRIYHPESQYVVQSGDSFATIAYNYGIPYPWIQAANPALGDYLSVGQAVTIPSPDVMLPLPIVYGKRIVVNIAQQHLWAYEDGQMVFDWVISTGIASSPTAPGIFQIQSHELNAYAANWNLWMPYFMGVYRPVPSSDFMNGFHGFPTRGNSQLLWTNNLGTPVTYGCILLSDTNIRLLYDWAEEGTVVEIQAR